MNEKDSKITGIFDSGVGGLSVLRKLLSAGGYGGNYLYFGDTANLPYGSKTKEEIIKLTRNIINFFIEKGANRVIMACNTSSALAYDTLEAEFGDKIKIHPLIQTAAPYIVKEALKNGTRAKIGVMSTEATAKSLVYTREIQKINPEIEVFELACPNFVKIVENRLYDAKKSIQYIEEHLQILLEKKCDKIVLGCTHYPYLMPVLTKFAPEDLFIDPAICMQKILTKTLSDNNLSHQGTSVKFYVSKAPETFRKNASVFMEIRDEIHLTSARKPSQILIN